MFKGIAVFYVVACLMIRLYLNHKGHNEKLEDKISFTVFVILDLLLLTYIINT